MSGEAGTEVAAALNTRSSATGPVMVVGMHRSGTSFLTGSLQLAGLELGKHSAWNPYNLKGNRENDDFVAFHEKVLAARAAAWDQPPERVVRWTPEERQQAQTLVAGYSGAGRWGFKDPRALLMAEAWQELLPDLAFVGIFRHPTAVARSLARRNAMQQEQAFALWSDYNRRLLALHDRSLFPLLCFDEGEEVLRQKLDRVLGEIGLKPLGAEQFYSSELRRFRRTAAVLPKDMALLYGALRARAC